MNYIELSLELVPDFTEIITAELGELGYESFVETEEGLLAYIVENEYNEAQVKLLVEKYEDAEVQWQTQIIERRNWNEEWEKSYQPIEVDDKVRVRASFHEKDDRFEYDLLITPKMSFGTGHHETTWLVMRRQLSLPHHDIDVLDVGCGTGILAILARKLGANHITAFDIDEWCIENTTENFELNGIRNQQDVFQGTIDDLAADRMYGGILANINRNILLNDMASYEAHLLPGGWLVVSGFYESDAGEINECAAKNGLKQIEFHTRNQWATLVFRKAEQA